MEGVEKIFLPFQRNFIVFLQTILSDTFLKRVLIATCFNDEPVEFSELRKLSGIENFVIFGAEFKHTNEKTACMS